MKLLFYIFIVMFSFSSFSQIVSDQRNLFQQANKDIFGKTPETIHLENLASYKKFVDQDIDSIRDNSQGRAKYLSPKVAQEVFNTAEANPVVALNRYSIYDPDNKGIGFCFGRALFINLELAQRGFDRDSIKKAIVVGKMGQWGWHVTTIVQSKDKKKQEIWLAIDPIEGVVEVSSWYEKMRSKYSTDKMLKLYITSADRLGANGARYDESLKTESFYNNYFRDMMEWFDQQSRTTSRYQTPISEY